MLRLVVVCLYFAVAIRATRCVPAVYAYVAEAKTGQAKPIRLPRLSCTSTALDNANRTQTYGTAMCQAGIQPGGSVVPGGSAWPLCRLDTMIDSD